MRAGGYLVLFALLAYSTPSAAKSWLASSDRLAPRALSSCSDFIAFDQIRVLLEGLSEDYGEIAAAFSIGTSVERREIPALRLSANPGAPAEERAKVRIIGGIHGNECMSVQQVAYIAVWLANGYGDDPFVTRLLDEAEVVLVPTVNPDGYDGDWATRSNANGVDLNRNLHFAWVADSAAGPSPFSEPETRAVRDLSRTTRFTVGLSYHTHATYVNAPWNYSPYHPPDEALFQAMGEAYAGTSAYHAVFGWDWYDIEGDVNDWSLGVMGTFDWTLELISDLDSQWDIHSAGLEGFLSFVFQGAAGVVTDGETGAPLSARIEVSPEGVPVFTDPGAGDYHRVLLPGRYDVTAIAEGYHPETRTGVVVEEDNLTFVDFELEPLRGDVPLYGFSVNGMTLPSAIRTNNYQYNTYLNRTMVWDALGEPDGVVYSLSPGGTITVDMGASSPVADLPGSDLRLVAGEMGEDDPVTVQVAEDQDGPFETIAEGTGTFEADIGASGFGAIRFVRLVDESDGVFNAEHPGYDLDAVVHIARGAPAPSDGGEPPPDAGDDAAAWRARAGDCGCRAAGGRPLRALRWLTALVSWR
jgi:hypothetical protein